MILRCTRYIIKGNQLLLKDFSQYWKIRFLNTWQAISKNVLFDVLDDFVNKYNDTVHRTIKMKPVDVKDNTYVNSKNF